MPNINNSLFNSLINKFSVESFEDILDWIKYSNLITKVSLEPTNLLDLKDWNFHPDNISHTSGKFFSIQGIRIEGYVNSENIFWDQPIINQPEIGYLGIICREFNGVLHFLLQAKIEPGNVNKVQLSPTIQATKSNFTKVHKGRSPSYLEEFQNCKIEDVILDQLQSEQGARFFQKRNRNIIILKNDVNPIDSRFKWVNLYQIKKLMLENNLVNMDTRTVIGCLNLNIFNWHSFIIGSNDLSFFTNYNYFFSDKYVFALNDILAWLTKKKLSIDLVTNLIPLNNLRHWNCKVDEIAHVDNLFFKVIGVNVKIENREVQEWSQPMIKPLNIGHIALFYTHFKNNIYFLVRAKFEIGSFDKLELGPTIQTSKSKLGFVDEFAYNLLENSKKVLSVLQSEEGGRFYHEENLNEIFEINYFEIDIDDTDLIWMSYSQIQELMKYSAIVNIQLRTMMSLLSEIPSL
jgi:oxidase EvaA